MVETILIYDQGTVEVVVVDIYDPFPDEECPRDKTTEYNEKENRHEEKNI